MNYADFGLGTFQPQGGMYSVILGMKKLAERLGVTINTGQNVQEIVVENKKVKGIVSNGSFHTADMLLSGADYHHTETLLPQKYRQYSEKYWDSRTFAPSSLLFYIGFDKKIKNVEHHTLFFDVDFEQHAPTHRK